ncbi:MAG TPA: hypothetical protein VLX68_06035 [Chitinivibrionales bacterium]|nr:hypothetical protein [Chitinivibrionales bacterium]
MILRFHFSARKNLSLTALMIIVCQCMLFAAPRIDRIDLYDNADNHLLFVTFDYDASGKNTGRTVFTSDSTFLRHTTFQTNAGGDILKETSVDFDSNTAYYTSISPSASATTFSVFDQFGLDQLGGPVTYAAAGQNAFDLSQNGAALNRITYDTAADGGITRINVLDRSGDILYYATVTGASAVLRGATGHAPVRPVLTLTNRGQCLVVFEVEKRSTVSLEIFTLSGRCVERLFSGQFAAGEYSFRIAHGSVRLATGMYLFRLSINGGTAAVTRGMVERKGALP